MLNDPQIERMLSKLRQLEATMEPYVFSKVASLSLKKYETMEQLYSAPSDEALYTEIKTGDTWGKERSYCWLKGEYVVPSQLANSPLYIYPKFGGYEALLYVNSLPYGNFAYKICPTGHGNHYCDLLTISPKPNEKIDIVLEAYAGHFVIGCYPFEKNVKGNFNYQYESVDICTKNQDIADFIYDLRALNQLASNMDSLNFRQADVVKCLAEVHKVVCYSPEHSDEAIWRNGLKLAREIMRPCLAKQNSVSAPKAGLIGHSHMDTAWLWDITETIKKCARTYSNQLALMEQFPEYKFVQSSAYHLELIRRHYPTLFEAISMKIKEGRYEPNGAVWVECDCNITGGESMVRQFLWGQKYTQKYFDFTSDAFWLPDTFGYSAAIPQIMKKSRVNYFLTTKLSWNDTTTFPYETFEWEGIDGTKVLTHFNITHSAPDPQTLIRSIEGRNSTNLLKQKTVSDERLISYGLGDGGGGPEFEMVEMARRCVDLEGCPKAYHTTVSDFMKNLEENIVDPSKYAGELYLELHRGTLTNQHMIKYNNRKAEIAIRDAEILTVANAIKENAVASDSEIRPLLETLLVNQFHDILPGTCIQSAHEQSTRETTEVIKNASAITTRLLACEDKGDCISVVNTLSFDVKDIFYIEAEGDKYLDVDGYQQFTTDINGNKKLAVSNVTLPAMSSTQFSFSDSFTPNRGEFLYENGKLETRFATILFNEKGYIKSYIDRDNGRELVSNGYAFNTFLFAEDVPSAWDNWDIDADLQVKFKDCAELLSEEVISNGNVELRIRRKYRLSPLSTITQDMIFYTHTARIDFETIMDWHDKRHFLKTAFDTTILARQAKHEIQFGYVSKPTTRNTPTEQAMFEVVNHKYTDLSETQYGVAILNDCKYGISVEGGNMRLSLHKGGIRPDPRGDEGVHHVTYSFLPHSGGFSSESVIRPAYIANYKPSIIKGEFKLDRLFEVVSKNVIIEAVKPCEDNEKACIIRLYEAEGTYAKTYLNLGFTAKKVEETNLLEEVLSSLDNNDGSISLEFKPFEIKSVKVSW